MLMIRQCEAVLLGIVGDISQLQVSTKKEVSSSCFLFKIFSANGLLAPYCTLSTSTLQFFCVALQEERSHHYIP